MQDSRSSRTTLWIVVVAACVLFGVVPVLLGYLSVPVAHWSVGRGIHIGMGRADVLRVRGEPRYVAHNQEELKPGSFKPVPKQRIEAEVLVYGNMTWKLYVFVDKHGKVTHLVYART